MPPVRNSRSSSRSPKRMAPAPLNPLSARRIGRTLDEMFKVLLAHYGPQGWWPGDSALEVVVGAVLTQNTSWRNVVPAIARLKSAGLLALEPLDEMDEHPLAELIRPAGTHRVKAKRLKAVIRWFRSRHRDRVEEALVGHLNEVRNSLLSVHGVGPETADAILLYAGRRRSFVVDAYKRRIWRRHHLIHGGEPYDEIQRLAMQNLPPRLELYQEYHALLVEVGKRHCRTRARCEGCPLEHFPHDPRA